ncbi:unnamed protein product [Spirodela intermedia]|uniref:Uncharacterized protein n=1 Tax=Spirodela intermedia TaxID=51605 RepID=A0A7I8KTQ1_SPIIN|nr:unnamed protein product [Spirodela intermedia]
MPGNVEVAEAYLPGPARRPPSPKKENPSWMSLRLSTLRLTSW